jgi:cephalosporin-C deacetylase-like acetyl esterase
MSISRWQCLAVLLLLGSVGLLPAEEKLASRLARLEAVVAPAEERQALTNMVSADIQRRRQELNDRNTAAWMKVTDRRSWEQFRTPILAALKESLGHYPPPPASLNLRVMATVPGDGFRIDNVVFESRPGLWVTANLYRPDKPASSMPGILICHAHHTPKEHGELQDMGMTWARNGCLVLVMDQLGHGDRRQHPFVDAQSYSRPFQVSRQDYHFRYDNGIQLHLVGDSLIGWMVWDLRRGVDLLLAQPGVDPKRIILLGAVAGGGDPAAVTAALDERIAAVVPFNFGSPSPRPHYPFPPEKEPHWNYAGGGSWESTRNLRRSAVDGFMPWVLVGSVAPRRLIVAHEFSWFQEGDPSWKRLQAIYGFYEMADRLTYVHGKGDVSKRPPEATHATHIGKVHRQMMHPAFQRWFAIDMTTEREYSGRLPAEKLRCLTPESPRDLQPRKLSDLLPELAEQRMAQARKARSGKAPEEQRRLLQADWARILGNVQPAGKPEARQVGSEQVAGGVVERVLLNAEPGITVPLLLLLPKRSDGQKVPVVVAVCQAGKAALLRERASDVAALLDAGVAVCLPDVRGTGETGFGRGRGRSSMATALSSSELMLGGTLLGGQLRDLRSVLAWLRGRGELNAARLALWGDSLAPVNTPDTSFLIPRDSDDALPAQSEPLGGLLALLGGLYEDGVRAIYQRGGLAGYRSALASHLVLIPHDAVVPGVLTIGDLCDVAEALAPQPVRLEGLVDGWNRRLTEAQVREVYHHALDAYRSRGVPEALSLRVEPASPAPWLLARLIEK